jgi:DNA ligase-1
MTFNTFATYLSDLEKTASRLEMTALLAQVYQELSIDEIQPASYLLQGQLKPAFASLEFQLSTKSVLKALALWRSKHVAVESSSLDLFGQSDTQSHLEVVTASYKLKGDMGACAEELLGVAQPSHPLSLLAVYERLERIAQDSGEGSQDRKAAALVELLEELTAGEARFVVRIILGTMRLGFSTQTLFDAWSWAIWGDKRDHDVLELAYQRRADAGVLAQVYLKAGEAKDAEQIAAALATYDIELGTPVVPALCQRLNSAEEIAAKMGEVMVEPKYDGVRVQLHVRLGAEPLLKTFTRSLEENTHQFPELVAATQNLRCQSVILDAEAIGFDPVTGELKAFQETITRKRKHDVAEVAAAVPLRFYIFDVLYLDGQSLLALPLRKRKELLDNIFDDNEVLIHTPVTLTTQPEIIRKVHTEQLALGLEGAVIKQADSIYQSGRQGWSWVKIKEAEGQRGKLSDTIDAVVMGYYAGRGKRAGFGVGAFLVGVRGTDDTWITIAKIGTGLTDEQFRELKTRMAALETPVSPPTYRVPKELAPDVWLSPGLVVEIAADELTTSPLHTAGLALRFPRLIKFRDDKGIEGATTVEEIRQLHALGLKS